MEEMMEHETYFLGVEEVLEHHARFLETRVKEKEAHTMREQNLKATD